MTAGAELEDGLGVAFSLPLSGTLRRRLIAGATALAANLLIFLGLIFMPHRPVTATEPASLDIVFVTLPAPVPQPEPAADPEPETAAEPLEPEAGPAPDQAPEQVPVMPEALPDTGTPDTVTPDTGTADATDADAAETGAGVEAPNILFDTNPFNDDRVAMPFPGGNGSTEYAVRSLFCLSTSEANRTALACPLSDGSEGLPLLRFASDENIARAQAAMAQMRADQIQALFARGGFPGRDLGGQATLADPSMRPTSSADQMRDTLPPLVPDPAFGD
ncbi:hypothetical protein MACH15_21370 [Maricaulis maris]|nr:hypothetical protein MACH15_21370 [Maricaulis maris]